MKKQKQGKGTGRGVRYSQEKLESLSRGTGISPKETLALVKKHMPESLKELEET